MQAKQPFLGKERHGRVTLELAQGKYLRVRCTLQGKTYTKNLGLYSPDCPSPAVLRVSRNTAQELDAHLTFGRIEEFINFFQSDRHSLELVQPCTRSDEIKKTGIELSGLWEKYAEFKKPQVSPSTYVKDFAKARNHIAKLPTKSLDDASQIRDWLLNNLSVDAARRCLVQIKAACEWALGEGIIDRNPFASMTIKPPKGLGEDADINPFTKEERDLIINAFASDRYYSYLAPFVRFLFTTGCRPSEAIGLQWKHVNSSTIRFEQAVVVSEDGLVAKEGLKTQRKRNFPITPEVQSIFDDLLVKNPSPSPNDYLFTSKEGKFIDMHNFSNRAWKSILEKTGIPYRKCYQTRHTFISLCVAEHMNSTAIGRWTGTSGAMIDKHYGATNFTNLLPPCLK
uniref:Integrase family protein n=1 Tax=Cyanothece sp. (strain PCC 7425 / ATCC 29141) TaxID=395961 RepID=B8HYI0_CYAP4